MRQLKSGKCSIKSGKCSIKSGKCRYLQGVHFTCIYRKISCKRLTFSVKLLLFCVERTFACWGWLWLFSIGSKQWFCPYKPYLLILNKNNAPLWMGNPRFKGIALGWLSDERFPRACSTSAGCFACKQDSGRAKALGICHRCRTAPTGLCRARQRSFVKAAVVYTDRLAPGFKSDWQDHSSIQVQTAPSNFLALASRVTVSATSAYQQFLSQSCKNP